MHAMILAAGRGERLRPHTDHCPKPLLQVGRHSLIERHLHALRDAGVERVVINLSWLGHMIREHLGDGRRYGLEIAYSDEGPQALETAGGIRRALPLLGEAPFIVVNADVLCDFPFQHLALAPGHQATLIGVDNPEHHPEGDFPFGDGRLTFSGIALYRPTFFAALPQGHARLGPMLQRAVSHGDAQLQHFDGLWMDIGNPERWRQAQNLFAHERLE